MIREGGYIKVKDGDICKLLFTKGYIHHGYETIDGKMHIIFPDDQDGILELRDDFLANKEILVNFRDTVNGHTLWQSNLHAFMDEKRYGKDTLQTRSKRD